MEKIGDDLYREAQSCLNKFNWWFIGPSDKEKESDAINCYIKAGDQYKLNKFYAKAGDAYYQAASLYYKHLDYFYAAGFYVHAAEMYKQCDKMLTESTFSIAIKLYHDMGRFDQAGKYTEEIIKLHDNLSSQLDLYKKTCIYYEASKSKYPLMHCLEKMVVVAVEIGVYEEAIVYLIKLCDMQLQYYQCFNYFLSINILKLYLGDVVDCKKQLVSELTKYSNYSMDQGYIFYNQLLSYYEENNMEEYIKLVKEYKNLKPWQKDLLLLISNRMNEMEDLT
jgi:alpha-soluble NSF attachment protein